MGTAGSKRRKAKPTRAASPYAERIASLRNALKRRDLSGYLVLDRMDQVWLTGFTGEDGAVLVTPRQVVLLTDGRFDETADLEAPWARKVLRRKRGAADNAKAMRRYRLERLGFDPAHMNVELYTGLRKHLAPARLVSVSGLLRDPRTAKTESEVAQIREAIDVAERAFERVRKWMRPGLREREVAARLVYEMQRLGAQGPSFPPIVASGPNASLPHYAAGDRAISADEAVLIDWGARVGWYVSDLTRVLLPTSIPNRLEGAAQAVRGALDAAIAAIRPGVKCSVVDRIARDLIHEAGFGPNFTHALGHGIGLDVHEAPRLGRGSNDVLAAGMVVTIEPGVYLPGTGGVRLEQDVLVTESGHEVLSTLPLDLD